MPVKFALIDEYKMLDNIKLNRAEATFRGRNYIIWYDASAKVKGGPWIFLDLPGLAYEIYDNEDRFRWTLQKINKKETVIENPFSKAELDSTISYKEFPKLKYNIQVFYYGESKKRGEYKSSEQKRTGLERTFEWEK